MYFSKDNKRSFQRLELNLPIVITKNGKNYEGTCLDLSSTGMAISFTTPDLFAEDKVHIQLDTEDERFPPLDAEARLLRRQEGEGGLFNAAVEFLALK